MKINITFDLDGWARRGIERYYCSTSPDGTTATYSECKQFIVGLVDGTIEDLIGDLQPEAEPDEPHPADLAYFGEC